MLKRNVPFPSCSSEGFSSSKVLARSFCNLYKTWCIMTTNVFRGKKKKKADFFGGMVGRDILFLFIILFFLLHWFVKYRNQRSFRHDLKSDKFCCSVIENIRITSLILGNQFKSWGMCDYQYTVHVNCFDLACLKIFFYVRKIIPGFTWSQILETL